MTRPKHYEYYDHITELVPGVFYEPGDSLYIVDDAGEVVCWTCDEWDDDPDAVTAAITAAVLAARHGTAAVRENIEGKGERLRRMVDDTFEEVKNSGCQ